MWRWTQKSGPNRRQMKQKIELELEKWRLKIDRLKSITRTTTKIWRWPIKFNWKREKSNENWNQNRIKIWKKMPPRTDDCTKISTKIEPKNEKIWKNELKSKTPDVNHHSNNQKLHPKLSQNGRKDQKIVPEIEEIKGKFNRRIKPTIERQKLGEKD